MFDVHVCIALAKVAWKGDWFAAQVFCDYCEEHGLARKAVKEMRFHARKDCRKLMRSSRKLCCTFLSSRKGISRLVRWMNRLEISLEQKTNLRCVLTWDEGFEIRRE